MVRPQPKRRQSLLESYCSQLGTVLEQEHPSFALVTAKRKAEKAAATAHEQMLAATAADRAKTKFLANMSHELRTPLNAIIGFSDLIRLRRLETIEQTGEYAGYIGEAGKLLLEIINGLLDLARIEAGKVELHEENIRWPDVLQSAVTTIGPLAEKKGLALVTHAAPDLAVRIDPTRFKQILLNLLSNAVKFTEPGGRIELASAALASGDLLLTVADSGVGIAPEHVERVFEPFEQVEDHLTRQNEGAGLGLAIARALAELHGARLLLRSAVGFGTTVELQLPKERVVHEGSPVESILSQPRSAAHLSGVE